MQHFAIFCLLTLSGSCLAGKNALYGYDILMLSDPHTPAAMLVDENAEPIGELGGDAFTYCLYAYVKDHNGQGVYTLHSYATTESDYNEIFMYVSLKTKSTFICVRQEEIEFANAVPELDKWTLACFSWTSETGMVRLYYNGVEVGNKADIRKGEKIGGNGILVMGQDQDEMGGGFSADEGMYGRLSQLNAWSRELTAEEVKNVYDGKMHGDLIDWRNSYWALSGNALVVASETPNAAMQKPVCTDDSGTPPVATDLSICLRFNGETCSQRESFVLFFYNTRSGSSQMSLVINDDKTTSLTMGSEKRLLPHLMVTPGWHHWCFVWAEGAMKVYIDGGLYDVLTDFPEGTSLASDGDLYTHEVNSRNRFTTNATDFEVWERALTKQEVLEDFMGRGRQQSLAINAIYYASPAAFQAQPLPYPMMGYRRPVQQQPQFVQIAY